MHPIFSVLMHRPELVMDHVAGYAALAREEAGAMGGELARRLMYWVVAAASGLVGAVLVGVAAMLGALHEQFHWLLVVVPGIALVIAVLAVWMARTPLPEKAFAEIRLQLEADAQALRTLRSKS